MDWSRVNDLGSSLVCGTLDCLSIEVLVPTSEDVDLRVENGVRFMSLVLLVVLRVLKGVRL